MSDEAATYSRDALEKLGVREKRNLAIDSSDAATDPRLEVVDDSQSSGYRDLFGKLIPLDKCSSKTPPKSISEKKRPTPRKKKRDVAAVSPVTRRSPRVFIPSLRIMKIMKDAQEELYSLMSLNKRTSDASVVSNESLNVSGIRNLLDSSTASVSNKINDNSPSPLVLEGVAAFVDYKLENNRSNNGIPELLEQLGAKVEKTFNKKVTHVVFREGYRKTYDTAIERKIPLVAARWVENSKIAKKILNPDDYPPIGIEKYTQPRKITYKIPKSSNKRYNFLSPSNAQSDNLLRKKYGLKKNSRYPITEEAGSSIEMIKTPKNQETSPETSEEPDFRSIDIIDIISDHLCKLLNSTDSIPDEKTNQLFYPSSLKALKNHLTPNKNEIKTSIELDSDLVKIEDRLNLNLQARQRLRKLLFPDDKELLNLGVASDVPSPLSQKNRLSALSQLTSVNKRKMQDRMIDELPLNKNVITDKNKLQEKIVEQNVLRKKISSCLRPKKTITKINVHKETDNLPQQTMPNMLSRNSSFIVQTPKQSSTSPVALQTIACTGMTKCKIDIIEKSVQNLGQFTFHDNVSPSTTYLITKTQPYRTLNMVFAMAYGCIIVSEDWVHKSHKTGRWLSHKQYLVADLSNPVKEFQTRRQTFGSLVTFHIFGDAGRIYISDSCQPPAKQLKQLVQSCGGYCTSTETLADVVVGYTPQMRNNVNEKWILDCITQGILLNKLSYGMTNDI